MISLSITCPPSMRALSSWSFSVSSRVRSLLSLPSAQLSNSSPNSYSPRTGAPCQDVVFVPNGDYWGCRRDHRLGWPIVGQQEPHLPRPVLDAVGHPLSEGNPAYLEHLRSRITTTIISPTFILAANFVIVGRLIRRLGTKYSRLSPRSCEFLSS